MEIELKKEIFRRATIANLYIITKECGDEDDRIETDIQSQCATLASWLVDELERKGVENRETANFAIYAMALTANVEEGRFDNGIALARKAAETAIKFQDFLKKDLENDFIATAKRYAKSGLDQSIKEITEKDWAGKSDRIATNLFALVKGTEEEVYHIYE